MPREMVPSRDGDRFVLDVGWSRDQDMQVGIRAWDDRHLLDEFYGDPGVMAKIGDTLAEALANPDSELSQALDRHQRARQHQVIEDWTTAGAAVGRQVLDLVAGSDYGLSSLWWHPTRKQVNDLMRLLRKARDAAFGKDE